MGGLSGRYIYSTTKLMRLGKRRAGKHRCVRSQQAIAGELLSADGAAAPNSYQKTARGGGEPILEEAYKQRG